MSNLPISSEAAGEEIKKLILERGIDSLTSKIIRKHLEATFNCSLSGNKAEIDEITVEKIKEVRSAQDKSSDSGSESEGDEEMEEKDQEKPQPSSKNSKPVSRKRKASDDDEDSDFEAPSDAKTKNGSVAGKKKGIAGLCELSEELQDVIGRKYMRRQDVVKAMWAYFKSNNLIDPKNGRQVICDEPLKRIFGKKKFKAFEMMSVLTDHITVAENLSEQEAEKILDELDPDRHRVDVSGDEATKKKKNSKAAEKKEPRQRRETAFTCLMTLSDPLAEVLGHKHMRRHQVVKAMWAYFREHDLKDPKDRRMVILDDKLKSVFNNEPKIQAFGMMRYLKGHMENAVIPDAKKREKILAELDVKYGKDNNGNENTSGSNKGGPKSRKNKKESSSQPPSASEDEQGGEPKPKSQENRAGDEKASSRSGSSAAPSSEEEKDDD